MGINDNKPSDSLDSHLYLAKHNKIIPKVGKNGRFEKVFNPLIGQIAVIRRFSVDHNTCKNVLFVAEM